MNDKPIHTSRDAHGHSVPPRHWRTLVAFALMPALCGLLLALVVTLPIVFDNKYGHAVEPMTFIGLPLLATWLYGLPALVTGIIAVWTRRQRTPVHLLQVAALGALTVALWELSFFHSDEAPFGIERLNLVMDALGTVCAVIAGALTLPRPAETCGDQPQTD